MRTQLPRPQLAHRGAPCRHLARGTRKADTRHATAADATNKNMAMRYELSAVLREIWTKSRGWCRAFACLRHRGQSSDSGDEQGRLRHVPVPVDDDNPFFAASGDARIGSRFRPVGRLAALNDGGSTARGCRRRGPSDRTLVKAAAPAASRCSSCWMLVWDMLRQKN